MTRPRRWFPLGFVACYWSAVAILGGFRSDHLVAGAVILALSYGGPRVRRVRELLTPLIATGIVFDSQRYCGHLRSVVHVAEPYDLERRLFGIPTVGGVLTPNEWWQLHTHPALDLLAGGCYIGFIGAVVVVAAYFCFQVSRTGTTRRSAEFVRERAPRMMWSLFFVSLLGFFTQFAYATAPPWYVAVHGLGPADLATAPSPAGCLRLERLLGIPLFTSYYAREVNVFGAVPSLHVAFPMLAVYYAFQFGAGRVFSAALFLAMCFSAVYLNHHYVLDVLAGTAYAVLVAGASDALHRAAAVERGEPQSSSSVLARWSSSVTEPKPRAIRAR